MLLSHIHQFIYLKTRKTAGTSVEVYFEPLCLPPGEPDEPAHRKPGRVFATGVVGGRGPGDLGEWWNHMPAADVREKIGPALWDRYFKFCCVRNPFDKVVSSFWFALSPERREGLAQADFSEVRRAFEAWLGSAALNADRPIWTLDDRPAIDAVIRYETLETDVVAICRRLGAPWRPERLGRYKADARRAPQSFRDYYTPETAEAVRSAYELEFAAFGYDPTP